MIMQSVPSSLLLFAALNFTVGLFFAGIQPSISAILANKTERTQRGRVFGMLFSAQAVRLYGWPLNRRADCVFFADEQFVCYRRLYFDTYCGIYL